MVGREAICRDRQSARLGALLGTENGDSPRLTERAAFAWEGKPPLCRLVRLVQSPFSGLVRLVQFPFSEVGAAVGVDEEDVLAVVGALGNVMRDAGQDYPCLSSHRLRIA